MNHELINKQKDKTYTIALDGKIVKTQIGNRKNEKTYPSVDIALDNFQKKEWKKLKEGYVYLSKTVVSKEAKYHKFIGKEYTGCLSLVKLKENIGVYKHNDFENDLLQVISPNGLLLETIKLPKALPWKLDYLESKNTLFMDVDHHIFQYDLSSKKFQQLTFSFDKPGSFIAVSQSKVFYGADPMVYLKDLTTDKITFSKKIKSELYSGHSPIFAGGISKNGNFLALSYESGKIEILNHDGELVNSIKGEIARVTDIRFLSESTIIIKEEYGSWGLRLFDIHTGEELPNFFDLKDGSYPSTMVNSFDIDWEENRLILTRWKDAVLFDLNNLKPILKFNIEHSVKISNIIFLDKETIAIRTDYGCFSLYHI